MEHNNTFQYTNLPCARVKSLFRCVMNNYHIHKSRNDSRCLMKIRINKKIAKSAIAFYISYNSEISEQKKISSNDI